MTLNRFAHTDLTPRQPNAVGPKLQLIIGLTATGHIHFVGGAVFDITGYAELELIGANWWALCQPQLTPEQIAKFQTELHYGKLADFGLTVMTKTGQPQHLYWQVLRKGRSTTCSDGTPAAADSTGTDVVLIGHLVATGTAAPQSPTVQLDELMYQLARDPAIALVRTETGKILDANAAFGDLYGYPHDRLLELTLLDLTAGAEQIAAASPAPAAIAPAPAAAFHQDWHLRQDGTIFPVWIGTVQLTSDPAAAPPPTLVRLHAATRPTAPATTWPVTPSPDLIREHLLGRLIQQVHAAIDPHHILPTILAEIREFFGCDRLLIYQLHGTDAGVVRVESVAAGWPSIEGKLIQDARFFHAYAHLYTAGRVQVISNLQATNLTPCHRDLLERLGVQANLVVPITDHQDLWGLLVAQQCDRPRHWQPGEIQFLRQIANQTAIAIRQFHLRQQSQAELQRRLHTQATLTLQLEQERLVSSITQRIRQSLDLTTILVTTVEEVRQFLQTDRVIIYQFQPQGAGQVAVESVTPPWPALIDMVIHDPCFDERYKTLYARGRSSRTHNVKQANLQPCYVDMLTAFGVQANLVVPILCVDQIWGLLIAHHCQSPRYWQSTEVELLKQLGDQVGIAIYQAQLYQQVQGLNSALEATVAERTQQLLQNLAHDAILKQITDKVRASLDESQMLEEVVQTLGATLGVEYCGTGIYDVAQTQVTITHEYAGTLRPIKDQTLTFSADSTIYLELLQGRIVQVCDLGSDTIHDLHSRYAILACPIVDDQTVLGDLWLMRSRDLVFSQAEVSLVKHVAQHCAIALRQARLYEAAQQQVKELERLNQLKDDFLSTVSHELRTPMASIQLASNMIGLHLDRLALSPAQADPLDRYLNILHEEGKREISLIDDLLNLSRLEAGTEPLRIMAIQLQHWIPHLIESLSGRAEAQQQTLHVDIPTTLPALHTDLSFLERSLNELIQNAYKYTPAQEHIYVRAEQQGDRCLITVENTGVEIPATEHDRIFDKFYRIPNQNPWQHSGTGLGLALVRRMVRHLHGTITVSTETNRTRFCLSLPWQLYPDEAAFT